MSEQDKAPVEQEQEPVAWCLAYDYPLTGRRIHSNPSMCKPSLEALSKANGLPVIPLYTHPKQWAGLTEEERLRCEQKAEGNYFDLCRAIEAKLKGKNNGY